MTDPERLTLKTYSHLGGGRRMPSTYEVVSSKLLYYTERGFEVDVPLSAWYAAHQRGSPLTCEDWEQFADPRATTYATYVEQQARQEIVVSSHLTSDDYKDASLSPASLATLEEIVAPLRFPIHGLQLVACYVGHMAPSGRITIASAFQAADELRRIEVLARRLGRARASHPGLAATARDRWLGAPEWQPLRRLIERLLVTYDWGEALVALNVALKPVFDALVLGPLRQRALTEGDATLASLLATLREDASWHERWADKLLRVASSIRAENVGVVEGWRRAWQPAVSEALTHLTQRIGVQ